MAIIKERSFPRGGRKSTTDKKFSAKSKKVHLFDTGKKKKKVKNKIKKSKTAVNSVKEIISAEHLNYSSLTDGMLLLGCIIDVHEYYIRISLPGRLVGQVPIINVSGPYTNILKSLVNRKAVEKNYYDLTQMFKTGQFVVARVLKIVKSEDNSRYKVELTLDPDSVNSNYTHSAVTNGMVLQGSVKSIEDHGYMIDFGIKSLTAFLKTDKAKNYITTWNDSRPLGVGQVVTCRVQKVDNTSTSMTIIQVTADPKEVSSSIAASEHKININTLIPGSLVKSLVVENIRDGLMVEFLNFKGFVHRDHVGDTPPKLADIRLARVLYTVPLLNTVYLSLLLGHKELFTTCKDAVSDGAKIGQIMKNAEVITASKRGLLLMLGKNVACRGYVARKRLKDGEEMPPEDVKRLYSAGNHLSVRIIGKDMMENIFICSSQQSFLDDEYFCIDDMKVGMKVSGTVMQLSEKGVTVKLGKSNRLKGFAHMSQLADFPVQRPEKRFSKGKKVDARVLKITKDKGNILLTFKPSLIESDLPIIDSYEKAANVKIADGTIINILDNGLIVLFFGGISGYVPIHSTGHNSRKLGSLSEAFYVGQTVRCSVVRCLPNQNKLKLSLLLNTKNDPEIMSRLGHLFALKVIDVNDENLVVKVLKSNSQRESTFNNKNGIIPKLHLSDHASLTNCLLKTYKPGSEIPSAVLFTIHYDEDEQPVLIFSLRSSVIAFCQSSFGNNEVEEDNGTEDGVSSVSVSELLEEGSVIPCSILKAKSSGILLESPIPHHGRKIYVPLNFLSDEFLETPDKQIFCNHKLIFGKVMQTDRAKRKILLATRLSEVWNGYDLEPALALLKSYLSDVDCVRNHINVTEKSSLGRFVEGKTVEGTVKSISDAGASVEVHEVDGKKLKGSSKLCATVIPIHYKNKPINVGEKVVGRVIFVDVVEGQVYLTLNTKTIDEMERAAGETFAVGKCVRAEILFCSKNVAVSFVKGNVHHGELVYLPVQYHYNDYCGCVRKETELKPGVIHKVIISGKQDGKMIGLIKKDVNAAKKYSDGKRIKRKRKARVEYTSGDVLETEECSTAKKKLKKLDKNPLRSDAKEKVSGESETVQNRKIMDITDPLDSDNTVTGMKNQIVDEAKNNASAEDSSAWEKLPRLQTDEGFIWGADILNLTSFIPKNVEEDSSADEEAEEEPGTKNKKSKKKKNNALLREEEEAGIREAEDRLMDPETCPQTADDFDRLVLSSPDSSIVWLKYVAFHLQNTEIDKARAVGQRALKTINFREEQEKFNIWVCLFNLENLYGTKESLEKVLQDGLQMNESLKVYSQVLQIYLDSKKIEDLDNIMEVMLKKHKGEKEAWVQAGTMCMKSNRPDKAGELLRRSFKSLPKRDHVDVICRWAQLETRSECGSIDRAQSLLEGVLAAYPKRTDVWSSLVDTLVKAGRIESARNIMERSVTQKLPMRKMKVLFKKYLSFEETHGTPTGAARVRQLAMDYVQKGLEEVDT